MGLLDRLQKAAGALRGDQEPDADERAEQDDGPEPSSAQMERLLQTVLPEPTEERPRSMFHDPYAVMDWGGWREKPTSITYETLRQMAQQTTAVGAIIQVRVNQVAAFARPQQGRYDRGYRIILRDRRDQKRTMTPAEEMQAAELERIIETTGVLRTDERPADRDSFRAFLKKTVRDILIYDQWCFEKIRDRRGKVSQIICLPAEVMRPAVADIEHIDPAEMRQRVSHVQVYNDNVIAEFSPDDIAWCVMNPRSDLRANGFGFSPVEQLISLCTAWLFGFQYNTKFFTQGANIKGLINIKGAIPDKQLKAFRRMWYSMVAGVGNAWRTPILNSEDLQWVSMHSTNSEMEYGAWMDWLTKLICGVFGMDPMEINFIFGNTGVKSALNQVRPNEDQVVESKDKGLTPLVEFIEDAINMHVVWDINPDFEFSFTGLNAKEEKQEREAKSEEVERYKTVDEARAELDLDPLPGGKGNVILNPVWLQASQGAGAGEGGGGGNPLEHVGRGDDEEDSDAYGGEDDDQQDDGEGEQSGKPPRQFGLHKPSGYSERVSKSVDAALAGLESAVTTALVKSHGRPHQRSGRSSDRQRQHARRR